MKPHSVLYAIPAAVLVFWLGHMHGSVPVSVPAVPTVIEVPAQCIPVDCSAAALAAAAAVAQECSETLDCRNVWRHPDNCSADCKYHALERGLGLNTELGEE